MNGRFGATAPNSGSWSLAVIDPAEFIATKRVLDKTRCVALTTYRH